MPRKRLMRPPRSSMPARSSSSTWRTAASITRLEYVVEFIRDSIVLPNVGRRWVNTWTPLLLTFFLFILCANAIGLIPIFEVLALVDRWVLHTGEHSFVKQVMHGGTT